MARTASRSARLYALPPTVFDRREAAVIEDVRLALAPDLHISGAKNPGPVGWTPRKQALFRRRMLWRPLTSTGRSRREGRFWMRVPQHNLRLVPPTTTPCVLVTHVVSCTARKAADRPRGQCIPCTDKRLSASIDCSRSVPGLEFVVRPALPAAASLRIRRVLPETPLSPHAHKSFTLPERAAA